MSEKPRAPQCYSFDFIFLSHSQAEHHKSVLSKVWNFSVKIQVLIIVCDADCQVVKALNFNLNRKKKTRLEEKTAFNNVWTKGMIKKDIPTIEKINKLLILKLMKLNAEYV